MTQSPCTWTFDWLTQPAGLLLREETGWVLRGRPNTSPADDGWLVAHVFHHRPDDTGSYSDEVATFGAETWMDEPFKGPDDLQRSLANSWLSVCLMTLEQGTRGAEGLRVKTPIDPTALDQPQAGMWRGCMKMALREAQEVLGEYGDPETWAALASDEHCDRLLSPGVVHPAGRAGRSSRTGRPAPCNVGWAEDGHAAGRWSTAQSGMSNVS